MKGRKLDSHWRPRDEIGWIIPTEGTFSRQVYDLMKTNSTIHTIARITGKSVTAIYQARVRIRNPDKFKIWHRKYAQRKGLANVSP